MKKFICLFCMVMLTNLVQGQTLHAIIFADTNDPNVGRFDNQDYMNLTMEVSTISSATGLTLKRYFYKGSDCSNANLRHVLGTLSSEPDDVILFYYSGHGVRSVNDHSDFPQMCLGSFYDQDFYPLQSVLESLNRQPARLKIVMGDCCNSVSENVTPKEFANKGATVLTKKPVNVYGNLFLNNQGYIIASSSRKGETSSTMSYTDGTPAGGAFTCSLLDVIQAVVSQGLDNDWTGILDATKELTYKYRKHTPVYEVNIKNMESHSNQTTENYEPHNTASPEEQCDQPMDKISLLTALANEKADIDLRVKVQDKALDYAFASPDVKVEVVGRNGVTVVSTEKASDFLLRLCTAHNLINLVEVDCTIDSQGKYTYLKVHEIYKK